METLLFTPGENFSRLGLIEIGHGQAGNLIRHRDAELTRKAAGNDVIERIHFQP